VKLEDVRTAYYEYSAKVSDIARTLSLAGIGVIWIFKTDSKDGPHVPHALILPAFSLVAALTFDVLHYLVATIIWGSFNRYKERKATKEGTEFRAPVWFNWPTTFVLFPLKILAVAFAYFLLLQFLWLQLR
jgi:hypothetical protein